MRSARDVSIADQASSQLREFARALKPTAPRSAVILANLASDVDSDGPVGRILLEHPAAGTPLFGIRALAGLNHALLGGAAPDLDALVKGDNNVNDGEIWAVARSAFLANAEQVVAALDRPVQQHLPQRAHLLLRGLAMLQAPRVRLLEIGACAGLNLRLDQYAWTGPDWTWGDPHSPVELTGSGPAPGAIEIVDRAGCDLDPRDPASDADVQILRSFIPPEHDEDLVKIDEALALARRSGMKIATGSAADWLSETLERPAPDGVVTVVWHSLVWLYLDEAEQLMVESVLASAARRGPLARISFEPTVWGGMPKLQVAIYS